MKTAFLIDTSASISDNVIEQMAAMITKRFRPDDSVFLFDLSPEEVYFVGNPTVQDIVTNAKRFRRTRSKWHGTNVLRAVHYVELCHPGSRQVILSDGYIAGLKEIKHELIKFYP